MQMHRFFILFLLLGLIESLYAMDEPTQAQRKTRGAPQHHRDIKHVMQPLEGKALEEHIATIKKTYEERKKTFSVPSQADIQQLQEARNLVLHPQNPETDYARAQVIVQKLISQTRTNTIKAEALFLRGIMRFNGLGEPVNLKNALTDFNKILAIPEDLEIKPHTQNFKQVTIALLEITDEVHNSKKFEDALLETKVILDELPVEQLNADLLDRILKIIKYKYPNSNLFDIAIKLDIPQAEILLQELIEKKPLYAQEGNSIIEEALKNRSQIFLKLFKIPSLAHHILVTQDALIQAIKSHSYFTLTLLFDAGASFNFVNSQGENPLVIAIMEGNPRLVNWLLDHQAKPLYPIIFNNQRMTPLSVAYTQEYPNKEEILNLLPKIPIPQAVQKSEQEAAPQEHIENLTEAERIKRSAIQAYQSSFQPIISLQPKRKMQEDLPPRAAKDPKVSLTPTQIETMKQQTLAAYKQSKKDIFRDPTLLQAARENDIPTLEKLMGAGANINEVSRGENALTIAIKNDNVVLVEWLLNHGANPQMPLNLKKDTPYLIALRTNKPNSNQIINRLLMAIKGFQASSGRILLPKPTLEIALPLDYNPETHTEISSFTLTSPEAEYNWLMKVALENPDPERKAYAEYRLGNMFFYGNGIQPNLDRALQHYQRAAGLSSSYIRTKSLVKINEIAQIQLKTQGPL